MKRPLLPLPWLRVISVQASRFAGLFDDFDRRSGAAFDHVFLFRGAAADQVPVSGTPPGGASPDP